MHMQYKVNCTYKWFCMLFKLLKKMGLYLAASQFDPRGEGATRVLTFRGVEAENMQEKYTHEIHIDCYSE